MNKKNILISALCGCFLLAANGLPAAQAPDPLPPPVQEKLVYSAKFFGLPVGAFIIQNNGKMMINGKEAYQFELTVKTLPFFAITLS